MEAKCCLTCNRSQIYKGLSLMQQILQIRIDFSVIYLWLSLLSLYWHTEGCRLNGSANFVEMPRAARNIANMLLPVHRMKLRRPNEKNDFYGKKQEDKILVDGYLEFCHLSLWLKWLERSSISAVRVFYMLIILKFAASPFFLYWFRAKVILIFSTVSLSSFH